MTDPALQIATDFISQWEGFSDHPYRDSAGVWTVGFGFTYLPDGQRVTGTSPRMTREEALAYLSKLVAATLARVRSLVYVDINDNQAAALTSLAYNVGTAALGRSILLLDLNKGNYRAAAVDFGSYVYAGGHVVQGLVNRRKAERALFETPSDVQQESPADQLMDAELARLHSNGA